MSQTVAYCGPAPTPAEIALAWNLDPPLLAALALVALWAARRGATALGAWAVLVVAFVAPLCALSAALFSARVAHHILLTGIAAPLLALALPLPGKGRGAIAAAFAVHAVVFWLWHAPPAYAWGVGSVAAYWLMQASLLATAWWFWAATLARAEEPVVALGALAGTVAHMGLLGALLAFAPVALYGPHLFTTAAWGLDALEDQQLAGLMMWTIGLAPYLGAAILLVWRRLDAGPARA